MPIDRPAEWSASPAKALLERITQNLIGLLSLRNYLAASRVCTRYAQ
jgi:hypothetical protein